ncbi:adenine specific DNA methyltransferase, D12 class [Roseibium sp. TrichSKD4]|uniref:DNA adenine methylase n=1 Tax=Roseibium sp. TrichSKD4 TaxID=744980 RepID=UPI0001E56FCA|nr:DNA adenine methylase [Roseibium sp. TrichSKD4]EFO31347.1 adenine specific DNA methyltransferase, D12 class [Roseibium sp. TrichSKD4]
MKESIETEQNNTAACLPPAPWVGGKRLLAKRLCQMIQSVEHKIYAEAFVGMGGVFFRRKNQAKSEIINDYSGDVANLFRILQRHYPQFLECIKFQITSRREFERLKRTDPTTLTDLERAIRFLYMQRLAFGGKVTGQNFGIDPDRGSRFNLATLTPMLEDVYERLSGVVIENLSFDQFIPKYDRPNALIYCDPPYYGCENDYGKNLFTRSDFEVLAGMMRSAKGKMILSINDTLETRQVFEGLTIQPVSLTYSLSSKGPTKARELIVSNFAGPVA